MTYTKSDLVELCEHLTRRRLDRWIAAGWISAAPQDRRKPYTELDRARLDLICHLIDDLEIAEDSMSVVLSLMDQVYSLRSQLRGLAEAVANQPPEVRAEIYRARTSRSGRAG
jgi:chaperone modulatory protein CbpM